MAGTCQEYSFSFLPVATRWLNNLTIILYSIKNLKIGIFLPRERCTSNLEQSVNDGIEYRTGFPRAVQNVFRGWNLITSNGIKEKVVLFWSSCKSFWMPLWNVFKGCRMGRSDQVSLWCVSLLISTRFRFFYFRISSC